MSNTKTIYTGIAVVILIALAVWGIFMRSSAPATDELAKPSVLANTTATTTGMAIGESATVNGVPLKVLSLVEDSRCPVDVQCIQAGTVRVRVSVAGQELVLTLGKAEQKGAIRITLTDVLPAEKKSTQTLQPSDYRFIFSIETSLDGKG